MRIEAVIDLIISSTPIKKIGALKERQAAVRGHIYMLNGKNTQRYPLISNVNEHGFSPLVLSGDELISLSLNLTPSAF